MPAQLRRPSPAQRPGPGPQPGASEWPSSLSHAHTSRTRPRLRPGLHDQAEPRAPTRRPGRRRHPRRTDLHRQEDRHHRRPRRPERAPDVRPPTFLHRRASHERPRGRRGQGPPRRRPRPPNDAASTRTTPKPCPGPGSTGCADRPRCPVLPGGAPGEPGADRGAVAVPGRRLRCTPQPGQHVTDLVVGDVGKRPCRAEHLGGPVEHVRVGAQGVRVAPDRRGVEEGVDGGAHRRPGRRRAWSPSPPSPRPSHSGRPTGYAAKISRCLDMSVLCCSTCRVRQCVAGEGQHTKGSLPPDGDERKE